MQPVKGEFEDCGGLVSRCAGFSRDCSSIFGAWLVVKSGLGLAEIDLHWVTSKLESLWKWVGAGWPGGQTCPCVDRMSVSTAESSHLHSAALWNRTQESVGMLELEPSFQGFLGFPASAKNSPLDDYHLSYIEPSLLKSSQQTREVFFISQ